jgi:hypothetical protein
MEIQEKQETLGTRHNTNTKKQKQTPKNTQDPQHRKLNE